MTAIHHVNGLDGGARNGGQGVAVPEVSIVVRSTFQTWFGRFATMVRPEVELLFLGGSGGGETLPGMRSARRTVVGPTWSAARASICAIRRAPIVGATALALDFP